MSYRQIYAVTNAALSRARNMLLLEIIPFFTIKHFTVSCILVTQQNMKRQLLHCCLEYFRSENIGNKI